MSELNQALRALPSVDEIASKVEGPRSLVVALTRAELAGRRELLLGGIPLPEEPPEEAVRRRLASEQRPSLRRVINATGVVLHTNLGRAPLADFEVPDGYSNLEYDLATGRRGKRDVHASALLERLTGRPGILVNNNAAAIFLALHELAAGYEVIVSRGELIEIGEGFRIPDIMARSGAILREVGSTNKTNLDDYRAAINERTRLILRVHPSNFHITGFTGKPALRELAQLAREHAVPLYEDLGSGCLVDLREFGIEEPLVSESLRAGVNVVSFSGDKLLGGPQAGILAGDGELIERLRRNPMFRAFRVDKLIYRAMETTLRRTVLQQLDRIPAMRMIRQSAVEIRGRAERLRSSLPGVATELAEGRSLVGGGSTPDQSISTWLIVLSEHNALDAEQVLRNGDPPVIARIVEDRLVLDLRTVFPEEEETLVTALQALSR